MTKRNGRGTKVVAIDGVLNGAQQKIHSVFQIFLNGGFFATEISPIFLDSGDHRARSGIS